MTEILSKNIRNLLKLIGLVTVISAVPLWFFSTDYPTMIMNRYLTGPVKNYMNVRIGDKREDILYKLGPPNYVLGEKIVCVSKKTPYCGSRTLYVTGLNSNFIDKTTDKMENKFEDYSIFYYSEDVNYTNKSLSVFFDKNKKVYSVSCTEKCDPVLGVGIGTNENRVIKLLGNNYKQKIDEFSFVKTLRYDELNITLYLEKQKVYYIIVGKDDITV